MATITIELYKGKKLADGRHPIRIRVIKDEVPKTKSIASAFPEEWDNSAKRIIPRSRKDYAIVNDEIEAAWEKYRKAFRRLDDSNKPWTAEDVFKEKKYEIFTFKSNALDYIETLTGHSKVSAEARMKKILRFTNEQDFELEDVNERWIALFRHHCKTKEKDKSGDVGNKDSTIDSAIKFLKRVSKFSGIMSKALSNTKIRASKGIKQKLTIAEIEAFRTVHCTPHTNAWHAKNFFLLMYYFRGMRVSDGLLLEWTDIDGRRLKYDSSKTSHVHDLYIIDEAWEILNYYNKDRKYVFPMFKWQYRDSLTPEENEREFTQAIKSATALINGHLKDLASKAGIKKPISTHISRHSFARNADIALDGDIKTIQKLLGHKTRAQTEHYAADLRDTDELDEASTKIFSKKQKPGE